MGALTMKSRMIVNNICYALCDKFNSRNNDFNGYWAIGVLYRHAIENGVSEVTLELLSEDIRPATPAFIGMIRSYREYLVSMAQRFGLPSEWLKTSTIHMRFNCSEGAGYFRSSCGDPYVLEIKIEASTGYIARSKTAGYSWPHDPLRETRRWEGAIETKLFEAVQETKATSSGGILASFRRILNFSREK